MISTKLLTDLMQCYAEQAIDELVDRIDKNAEQILNEELAVDVIAEQVKAELKLTT